MSRSRRSPSPTSASRSSSGNLLAGGACWRGLLLLTPNLQALLSRRQKGHTWRVASGVLLVQVKDPAVHSCNEAVVIAGPVGRPVAVTPDHACGAADLVDELAAPIKIDLHLCQRPGLEGGLPLTSRSARCHVAPPLSSAYGAYAGDETAIREPGSYAFVKRPIQLLPSLSAGTILLVAPIGG
jgi:hypothetical protein